MQAIVVIENLLSGSAHELARTLSPSRVNSNMVSLYSVEAEYDAMMHVSL